MVLRTRNSEGGQEGERRVYCRKSFKDSKTEWQTGTLSQVAGICRPFQQLDFGCPAIMIIGLLVVDEFIKISLSSFAKSSSHTL